MSLPLLLMVKVALSANFICSITWFSRLTERRSGLLEHFPGIIPAFSGNFVKNPRHLYDSLIF